MRSAPRAASFANVSAWPFLALVVGVAGYAWLQVILMAFSHLRIQQGRFVWTAAGLDNFRAILGNPVALRSVAVTVLFVAATVGGSVLRLATAANTSRRAPIPIPLAMDATDQIR